jgi:hypothetical protein
MARYLRMDSHLHLQQRLGLSTSFPLLLSEIQLSISLPLTLRLGVARYPLSYVPPYTVLFLAIRPNIGRQVWQSLLSNTI